MANFCLEFINKAEPLFLVQGWKPSAWLWRPNLTNMPDISSSLMAAVLVRQLFSKQRSSSAPAAQLTLVPDRFRHTARKEKSEHPTCAEPSVPSGAGSSWEAEACSSKTTTEAWSSKHEHSRTDSCEKWEQKDPLVVNSRHFLRLCSWEGSSTGRAPRRAVVFPKPGISWLGAGSSGLNSYSPTNALSLCIWKQIEMRQRSKERQDPIYKSILRVLLFIGSSTSTDQKPVLWEKKNSFRTAAIQTPLPFQPALSCTSTR